MIRAILIALLLLTSPALADELAFLPHGGGTPTVGCTFTGAQVNGSCVQAVSGSQVGYLGPDGSGSSWGLNGTGANCDALTPFNCLEVACNPGCNSANASGFQLVWQSGNSYLRTNFPTCGQLYRGNSAAAGWATAPGTRIGTGYFVNNRTGTSYFTMPNLVASMQSGDTVTVAAPPWATCWPEIISIATPNLTFNFGTAHFADATTSQGCIPITGTADGGTAANIVLNGGDFRCAVKIRDGATNNTVENATFHDAHGISLILTGGGVGTTTLTNDLVYGGGTSGSGGQDHNVYLSAKAAGVVDASCYAINGLTSLNSIGEGWLLKLRTICSSGQQGDVTNSVIATTVSFASPNGVIDFPCGGNHKIEHSILENAFNQGGNAGWYLVKYAEEVALTPSGCPSNTGQVNALVFNLDVVINDAPGNSSGFESVLCTDGGNGSGPTHCLASTLPGYSATMTNSVIVGNIGIGYMLNPGGFTDANVGCTLVAGKCTDANNNRWYQNRTTAATNEGWSGNYTDPSNGTVTACCAWPWLPPHL